MEPISAEFNFTDALLLYSTAYCQRHKYRATLGHILLTTDAFNRSMPMAFELDDCLSRLMTGGYIKQQEEIFLVTKRGMDLFDDVTETQTPKLTSIQQIKNLVISLNRSRAKNVSKSITITDAQYSAAIKEAHEIFEEVKREADQIAKARKME